MGKINGIKPQDIVVLLKLLSWGERPWLGRELALDLGLSGGETSVSLRRAVHCGLLAPGTRLVERFALLEFLIHGLKYAFPAKPGALARGLPTARSAPPLADHPQATDLDHYVWPTDDGDLRGQGIKPLYPSVPYAARRDPNLHEWLALVDAVRAGRSREQSLAVDEIKRRLLAD